MHHPIYSADRYHQGAQYMGEVLDRAVERSGRAPDAVFAGHVHNFQRYTRRRDGHETPYVVAGAGGYFHLHDVQRPLGRLIETPFAVPGSDVTLENFCDDRHGYMRLEVTNDRMRGEYFTVPRPHESWHSPARRYDTFALDLKQHRLTL